MLIILLIWGIVTFGFYVIERDRNWKQRLVIDKFVTLYYRAQGYRMYILIEKHSDIQHESALKLLEILDELKDNKETKRYLPGW